VSLEDIRTVNRELVLCGATIREINCVRKQLSRIKGGGLARLVGASTLIVLYISDVNAGDLASIASGPFLPDDSSKAEALSVLEKFHLLDRVPPSVRGLLSGRGPLTQHSSDTESVRGQHVLVQDNDLALRVAGGVAQARGFNVELDHEGGESFYRDEAERLIARFILLRERFPDEQVCLISGGEVACPARGNGAGGRNQEFVIYSATRLAQLSFEGPTAVLSAGTDGLDGNSGAAGAVAGGRAAEGAAARGLDPLSFVKQNNSHSFLKALGGLMITGPSGNNVRDVRLFLAGKPPQLHQSEPCLEEKG
jgi:hydroxypyruvate reductase